MDWASLSDAGIVGVALLALILFFRAPRKDGEGRMFAGGFAWMLIDAIQSIPDRLEPHFEAIREDLAKQTALTHEVSEQLTDPRRDSDQALTRAQRAGVRAFVRCAKALRRLPSLEGIDLSGAIAHLEEYAERYARKPDDESN